MTIKNKKLDKKKSFRYTLTSFIFAPVAQPVEHVLGKDEVTGSRPVGGFQKKISNSLDKKCVKIFNSNAPSASESIIAVLKTKKNTLRDWNLKSTVGFVVNTFFIEK